MNKFYSLCFCFNNLLVVIGLPGESGAQGCKDDSLTISGALAAIENLSPLPVYTSIVFDSNLVLTDSANRFLPSFNGINNFIGHFSSSQISVGYDYGLLQGYDYNVGFPIGTFVSDGSISVPLLTMPLQISYHYSTRKSSFGLNNTFQIGYDYQAFQKKIAEKKGQYIQKLTGQIDSLAALKQTCLQKVAYWNMVEAKLSEQLKLNSDNSLVKNEKEHLANALQDSLSPPLEKVNEKLPMDSSISRVKAYKEVHDTANISAEANRLLEKHKLSDSISKIKNYQGQFLALYKKYADKIGNVESTLDDVKSAAGNPAAFLTTLTPKEKLMLNTKKLDVGLCYPSSSMFLVNNLPLRGLQYEWSNDNYYLSAAAGMVQNNFLFSNNLLQNALSNTQNLFNFFDFRGLNQGRKVASIKGGIGKQDDTHLYIGWLSGWGLQSYAMIDSQSVPSANSQNKEYNAVIELDGRWQIAKTHSVKAIFSRSAIRNSGGETLSENQSVSSQLFDPGNKNNAIYFQYKGEISKTKTSLTATGRYIDPLFKSFGTGFMQSNNVRYEFRVDQHLFSSLKISGFIRQEHDNVLSIMQYTNSLRSIGISLRGNVSRNLTISGSYSPVFQHIEGEGAGLILKNQNDISNINIIYNHRVRKSLLTVNGSHCIYRLSDTSKNTFLFNNAGLYFSLNGSRLSEQFSIDYFNSNLLDSLHSTTWLYSFDLTCTMSKLIAAGELRCALNGTTQPSFGGTLKLTYTCLKFCSISLEGERIVKGDFYAGFPPDTIDKFPYLISTRLIFNL